MNRGLFKDRRVVPHNHQRRGVQHAAKISLKELCQCHSLHTVDMNLPCFSTFPDSPIDANCNARAIVFSLSTNSSVQESMVFSIPNRGVFSKICPESGSQLSRQFLGGLSKIWVTMTKWESAKSTCGQFLYSFLLNIHPRICVPSNLWPPHHVFTKKIRKVREVQDKLESSHSRTN